MSQVEELKIFLIAIEPSGDILGGRLVDALRNGHPGRVLCCGVGGEQMTRAGVDIVLHSSSLSRMGLLEVLKHVPRFRRLIASVALRIREERPDVVVLIDGSSFCLRVAERIRDTGIPIVQYVAPKLWAWRPGRAAWLKRNIDLQLVTFPFEVAFFARLDIRSEYVGHPACEDIPGKQDEADFRAAFAVADDAQVLLVLPGSRVDLFRRMAPVFGAAVARLRVVHPDLRVAVPLLETTMAEFAGNLRVIGADALTVPPSLKRGAFAAARAALTVSGTNTLELALAGVPMVVGHRVNVISGWIARLLIRVKWVALPNILSERTIVPEFLLDQCRPEALSDALETILDDGDIRRKMIDDLENVASLMLAGAESIKSPSERAADAILRFVAARLDLLHLRMVVAQVER